MKKYFFYIFISLFIIFSCNKDNRNSRLGKISFSVSDNKLLKNLSLTDSAISKIIVSIKTSDGRTTAEMKSIQLFKFNSEYISEPISLRPGEYILTTFLVLNDEDSIIYVAPIEGSEFDYLVSDHLPVFFEVSKDETTKVSVEVVSTSMGKPEDYGYVSFSLDIIDPLNIYIVVFVYDSASKNFELTNAQLTISAGDQLIAEKYLTDSTNRIFIKSGYPEYTLSVTKPDFQLYESLMTEEEIRCFSDTPLLVILYPNYLQDRLFGMIDNKLVTVDKESSAVEILSELNNPSNLQFLGLTVANNKFYTILNPSNNPALYEIMFDGTLNLIGNLTLSGTQIKLCESVAYNESDGNMYVSASIYNGVNENDYYSESILQVDLNDGTCTLLCNIRTDMINPDIDAMEIYNNKLYFYDGAPPGADYTKIYAMEFDNLCDTVMQPVFETNYMPSPDIAVINDQIYFINRNLFYVIDLNAQTFTFIGQTHSENEFNNAGFKGLAFN